MRLDHFPNIRNPCEAKSFSGVFFFTIYFNHRVVHLAEKVSLKLTDEQLELIETITDFNMEARYPDEKFSFKKRCTKDFTEGYLAKIKEMKEWLAQKIQS